MVTKISTNGRAYEIDGKAIVWHPEDDDGAQGVLPDIRVPLRLKLKLLLDIGEDNITDNAAMRAMLGAIIPPAHHDTLGEMDINDFQDLFTTWQSEYNSLTGGSLGEPSKSSGSSVSTEEPSSTTSAVSV